MLPESAGRIDGDQPRTLVVAESLPHPPLKGGDHRNWQNVSALAAAGRIAVFGLCSNDQRRLTRPELRPDVWTTSSDPALAQPPPAGLRLGGRAWLLDPHGHPSDLYYSEAAADELDRLCRSFQPDVAIVEGVWLHGYVEVLRAAGVRVVLDCHNVEFDLFRELARSVEGEDLEARARREILPARTRSIEQRAVHAVHEVWVCSDRDARRIRELYAPDAAVVVVPNGIDTAAYDDVFEARAAAAEQQGLKLVFPGFFGHRPNVNAGLFLIGSVFPRIVEAASQAVELWLVGALPPAELRAAAAHDSRIHVTGAVRDIRDRLRVAGVMPVPLFEGSGTRLKIIEAFAAGVPVVSTSKGAEGLSVEPGVHLLLAETAEDFVTAVLTLQNDESLRRRQVSAARALVVERYGWSAIAPRIRQAVLARS